jgi:hypothetical protein
VAIVSLSRIQVRRGQAGAGSGIPQLAGGELGWAMDTQELFIGNGSVAEGAPSVGNTKLLTEHDNLFELSSQYIYGNETVVQTGASSGSPIQRTLKQRLDDTVSVRAFGAEGSGSNEVIELQRAIDQLYVNAATVGNPQSRIQLLIPAGTYSINASLKLPPFTTLIGDGSDKTIITQTANFPVFETVNGLRTPGVAGNRAATTTLNQARHITIKGMTLNITGNNPAILVDCCANSDFEDIKIGGNWSSSAAYTDNFAIKMLALNPNGAVTQTTTAASGNGVKATISFAQQAHKPFNIGDTVTITGMLPSGYNGTYTVTDADYNSIKFLSSTIGTQTQSGTITKSGTGNVVTTDNNNFKSIKIFGFQQAVHSDDDVTENHFENCVFQNCQYGVVFGENTVLGASGQNTAPFNNTVSKSQFIDINRQGIWIRKGKGNKSISNSFESVGNDGGTEANAVYSVIKFETMENASHNDYFDRTKKLSTESAYTLSAAYVPEIEGFVDNTNTFSLSINVGYSVGFTNSFRLPADITKSYVVYYLYKSTYVNAVRHGTLEITVNKNNNTTSLTDTYDYVGDSTYSTNLDFKVILSDINADTQIDTVLVQTKDSTLNDAGTILFQVKVKS